jgi:hypothetical protein
MASTCSLRIRRGAGLPAVLLAGRSLNELTNKCSGNNNVDVLGLLSEQGHLGVEESLFWLAPLQLIQFTTDHRRKTQYRCTINKRGPASALTWLISLA